MLRRHFLKLALASLLPWRKMEIKPLPKSNDSWDHKHWTYMAATRSDKVVIHVAS